MKEYVIEDPKIPGLKTGVMGEAYIDNVPIVDEIVQLRKYYQSKVRPGKFDHDSSILYDKIEKLKTINNSYSDLPITNINGYDFIIFPKGANFYKALTHYYDKMPKDDKRVWVSDLPGIRLYVEWYRFGILAYKTNKELKLFVFNKNNMQALCNNPNTPPDVKQIVIEMFKCDMDLNKAINVQMKNSKIRWLFTQFTCPDDYEYNYFSFFPSELGGFRDKQHILMDYIEKIFNCNGIYQIPYATPFVGCVNLEIALHSRDVEIDYDNEWT